MEGSCSIVQELMLKGNFIIQFLIPIFDITTTEQVYKLVSIWNEICILLN